MEDKKKKPAARKRKAPAKRPRKNLFETVKKDVMSYASVKEMFARIDAKDGAVTEDLDAAIKKHYGVTSYCLVVKIEHDEGIATASKIRNMHAGDVYATIDTLKEHLEDAQSEQRGSEDKKKSALDEALSKLFG